MRIIFFTLIALVLFSCQTKDNKKTNPILTIESVEYWPTDGWVTSTPENQGMDSDTINKRWDYYGSKGSIVVVKNGFIVAENYPKSFDSTSMHHIFSCTKSVTSILLGISINQGLVKSEEDRLIDYFTDLEIRNLDSLKMSITLKDVLTMTSGMEWKGGIDGNDVVEMLHNQYDWTKFAIDKPMANVPGTKFNYNSGGSQILSSIVHRQSNMTAENFAKKYLFEPLGIDSTTWDTWPSKNEVTSGAWGLSMSVRDMAKLGYLFLKNGEWEDKKIVTNEWVKKSSTNYVSRGKGRDGYGYQWWVLNGYPTHTYSAVGMYGGEHAYITIIPEYDLVVAIAGHITGKMRDDIIKKYIINANIVKDKTKPNL
jgi:CubicO group peptidase (beta-lactamase class C family)